MAVKDFVNYYNEEEAQYKEMLEDAKDLEESYRAGHLSEESYEQAIKYIEAIRINHERLSYVMFLLTKRKQYRRKASAEKAEVVENKKHLQSLDAMKEAK